MPHLRRGPHPLEAHCKQRMAVLRVLFDRLVTGHIMQSNPAHAVEA